MKNTKISVRLFGLALVLCFALIISNVIALTGMEDIHDNTVVIAESWLPAIIAAEELNAKTAEFRLAESGHIIASDSASMQSYETQFTTLDSEISSLISEYQSIYVTNSTDTAIIQGISSAWTEYHSFHTSMVALSGEMRTAEAMAIFSENSLALYTTIKASCATLVDFNKVGSDEALIEGGEVFSLSRVVVFGMMVIFTIIGIIFSNMIINSLTRPIEGIEKAASLMAEGNLSAEFNYYSKDALGGLSDSMRSLCSNFKQIIGDIDHILQSMARGDFTAESRNPHAYVGDFHSILTATTQITKQLSNTLESIDTSSSKVSSGSEQVAHAAELSADGANKQADVVEHLLTSLNKIVARVGANAERSAEAKDKANEAANEIGSTSAQVEHMITSMDRISEKGNEIAKIIKVIDDIAFQTNILALNAAVEAARAGTAGKGFAVVADEVRNLADKSANSAKDTGKLIEETLTAVKAGTQVADDTAKSIYHVKATVLEVTDIMDEMAVTSAKQQSSLKEVTDEVSVISSVVAQSSGTAEESASASQELSEESRLLKSYISKFKLRNTRY